MNSQNHDNTTLLERLYSAGRSQQEDLFLEAAEHIKALRRLCGMMTDTGVILEEEAAELTRPDVWWVPGDGEYSYPSVAQGMEDLEVAALEICEWGRAHHLEPSFAVRFPEIADGNGRVHAHARVEEFNTYAEAERAVADHRIVARRYQERAL